MKKSIEQRNKSLFRDNILKFQLKKRIKLEFEVLFKSMLIYIIKIQDTHK